MITQGARRQRVRMRWRSWWHELSLAGWSIAVTGTIIGTLFAGLTVAIERNAWDDWCADSLRIAEFCQVDTSLAYQLEFGVAFGIIAMIGVVFTILLVSLQLVSGQFSPRLLQLVFQERRARMLIATLAGIFAFAMWSLVASVLLGEGDTTPGLGPLLVALAGLVGGILMVILLYGVARQQYIGTILERTASLTIGIVDSLRERGDQESELPGWFVSGALTDESVLPGLGDLYEVAATRSGWVQQLSVYGLLRAAPKDCVLRLETRVGAFVVQGQPLMSAWPRRDRIFNAEEQQALDEVVWLAVFVGTNRTLQDDIDFGIRQLTDVALKALSPAVNDPTTAIEAILRLSTVLRHMLEAGLPDQVHYESQNRVLLLHPWDLDAGEYVRHAFGQIRAAAADQPAVVICLFRSIGMLHAVASKSLERQPPPKSTSTQPQVAGMTHSWHLREALKELETQRRLALQQFLACQHPAEDVAYVRSALARDVDAIG